MSKVLVSFLGTGSNSRGLGVREYHKARYRFENGVEIDTSFVADALFRFYDIDKLILLGTPKSMWEQVYDVFCDNRNIPKNEDYWLELATSCDKANANSPLHIPNKELLESAIGADSHVVLIHYGLNEQELQNNASIILGIEDFLNTGDELYLDITHAFRSLPLYLMNLIVYLQNVSAKKVKLANISYGMLDVNKELGYAPVINLSGIAEINEWIVGAYTFRQFGNGYKIAELMKRRGEKNMSNKLTKFSDMLNLNHLDGIRKQTQELSAVKNDSHGAIADHIIPGVINGFIDYFPNNMRQSTFQRRLAQWHYNHQNYSSAFIALVEAIITYVCEELEFDWDLMEKRELAKRVLRRQEPSLMRNVREFSTVSSWFSKVNRIRISVAHSVTNSKNNSEMISLLDEALICLRMIIKG